jgi:hypothetical protein
MKYASTVLVISVVGVVVALNAAQGVKGSCISAASDWGTLVNYTLFV